MYFSAPPPPTYWSVLVLIWIRIKPNIWIHIQIQTVYLHQIKSNFHNWTNKNPSSVWSALEEKIPVNFLEFNNGVDAQFDGKDHPPPPSTRTPLPWARAWNCPPPLPGLPAPAWSRSPRPSQAQTWYLWNITYSMTTGSNIISQDSSMWVITN